jgi:hypothetical protein
MGILAYLKQIEDCSRPEEENIRLNCLLEEALKEYSQIRMTYNKCRTDTEVAR